MKRCLAIFLFLILVLLFAVFTENSNRYLHEDSLTTNNDEVITEKEYLKKEIAVNK